MIQRFEKRSNKGGMLRAGVDEEQRRATKVGPPADGIQELRRLAGVEERQSTHCLRRGLSIMAEAWEERAGGKTRLVPEEFVLHSGRIGCATR